MPEEYDPENEIDPLKIQREQLDLAKEFMAKMKEREAKEKAAEDAYAAHPRPIAARTYTPPTFEEVSAVLKKSWEGVEAIMPTAGDRVKAVAFQTLMQAAAPPPTFDGLTGG
jgi:hypothetical protein